MSDDLLRTPQKFTDLHLCGCGILRSAPLDAHGPAVSGAYCLFCAAAGKGSVLLEGKRYPVKANEGMLIQPNRTFAIEADEFDPWVCFWLAFDGSSAAACLEALGLGAEQEPFRCDSAALCALAEEAQRLRAPGLENEFLLQSLLYRFFACFARSVPERSELAPSDRESLHVRRAAEFIRTHYADGISVADVAKHVLLNRSYLSTLFQRVLGTSPQDYLARYRLSRAEEHLLSSDATVATIAYSCGYQDPQVFSKAFRNRYGLTPAKYRAAAAGKTGQSRA